MIITTKDLRDVTIHELMRECANHRTSGLFGKCNECPFYGLRTLICPDPLAVMEYYDRDRGHAKVTFKKEEWADYVKKISGKKENE